MSLRPAWSNPNSPPSTSDKWYCSGSDCRIIRAVRRNRAGSSDVGHTITGPSSSNRCSAQKSAAYSLLISLGAIVRSISSRQYSNLCSAGTSSLRNTVPIIPPRSP